MRDSSTSVTVSVAEAVRPFFSYANELGSLVSDITKVDESELRSHILAKVLNGGANAALQRLVPLETRKGAGLFFTNTALADKVAKRLSPMLKRGYGVLDPACGAGNLLLACARHLPVGQNLIETLTLWGALLRGYDLHAAFVRAAQIRLALLALSLHPAEGHVVEGLNLEGMLFGLQTADSLAHLSQEPETCIAVNPPFGHAQAPTGCKWATGRTQIAALFLDRLLDTVHQGQHVVAILPDVLRSGTRYHRWRDTVAARCNSIETELAGRFDGTTDVDVFILHAIARGTYSRRCLWPSGQSDYGPRNSTLSNFFEVRVGPVVPHRDPLEGPSRPYIHARTAPAWQTIAGITDERRYAGRVFKPPFVVVHRTSNPKDRHRCLAAIVNEARDVAVENHLLVLRPYDGSLRKCEQLLRVLKSPQTDKWLNDRIRCRHLTVSAVGEIPYRMIESNDLWDLSTGWR